MTFAGICPNLASQESRLIMKIIWCVMISVALTGVPAIAAERPKDICEYRAQSVTDDSRIWHWTYPVGTKLKGSGQVDINSDGSPEQVKVDAEIQRDYAVNPETGKRSAETFCWFRTRLEIRTRDGRLLYKDEWSIKYNDMPTLLETHGASSPEDYFARFGRHNGFFQSGADTVSPQEADIRLDAIKWSLAAQGIKGVKPEAIVAELSRLKTIHIFMYRAEWREDVRIAAYVPSIHKLVAIQVGY